MIPARSVLLVDPDAELRRRLSSLLLQRGFVTEEFSSAEEFSRTIDERCSEKTSLGCVVTEARLPGVSGLGLQARMARESAPLPVVFHSSLENIEIAVQAIQAGAVDYLLKPADPDRLSAAIERAFDLAAQRLEILAAREQYRRRMSALTNQHRRVHHLLVQGKNSKEIAAALKIGVPTVAKHRGKVLNALGAKNAVELARLDFSHMPK